MMKAQQQNILKNKLSLVTMVYVWLLHWLL